MLIGLKNKLSAARLSIKMKMTLSLSAIAMVLLLSSVISILEFRRMSNYVSELIADDINSIDVAQKLANVVDKYNLQILTVIGDDSINSLPDFDQRSFVMACDSLKGAFSGKKMMPLTDSVLYSYSAYMLTSLEMEEVIKSDFIDSRTWYFERLQPVFNRLRSDIDNLSQAMYDELRANSENFDNGFYRSIVPGFVTVLVGIILVLLLMFFINVFYVNPLNRMLDALDNYRSYGRKYSYTFEGDDQLKELSDGISELAAENRQLRHRISQLRDKHKEEE